MTGVTRSRYPSLQGTAGFDAQTAFGLSEPATAETDCLFLLWVPLLPRAISTIADGMWLCRMREMFFAVFFVAMGYTLVAVGVFTKKRIMLMPGRALVI